MGGCFSLSHNTNSEKDDTLCESAAANLITITGEFRQLNLPIKVSQVFQQIGSPSTEFFICSSDSLYYHEHIPALNSDHQLQSAQIYFLLPNSKLKFPLTASEMAALAVKASLALSAQSTGDHKSSKSRRCQISPVLSDKQSELGILRSGSIRKLQRYTSRRVIKLAARSFRLRLKTIHEGSDLLI